MSDVQPATSITLSKCVYATSLRSAGQSRDAVATRVAGRSPLINVKRRELGLRKPPIYSGSKFRKDFRTLRASLDFSLLHSAFV